MEAVQPRPIMATSLGGSLLGIALLATKLPRPIRLIVDADRWQRNALVMAIDPVAIIVMRARKADHFPRHHVPVAAIDRIGEKTGLRVGENEFEEGLAVDAVKFERAVFQALDGVVLLRVGEIDKGPVAEFGAAGGVERGERFTIVLRRRDRRLQPLLLGAVRERAPHIKPFEPAGRAGELAVDIDRTAAVLAAGGQIVGGDETVNKGFDR